MRLYLRISTFSRSASNFALDVGRTLKPTMIALDAEAIMTSSSVIAPAAALITFKCTSLVDSFSNMPFRASTLP